MTERRAALGEILAYLREVGVDDPQPGTDISAVLDTREELFPTQAQILHPGPLEVMSLVIWIEEHFGFQVEIDDIEVDNFRTPAVLGAYIEIRRKR